MTQERKTTFDGRRPLMENKFWQEMTYERRRLLTEDDLWRKTTIDERRPLTEDDLHIAGRHMALDKNENDPKEEDNLQWKTTFDIRQLLTEDDLWQKKSFDGRQPLTEDDLWQKMTPDQTLNPVCRGSSHCSPLGAVLDPVYRACIAPDTLNAFPPPLAHRPRGHSLPSQ